MYKNLETKVDLMFSIISNTFLANQAMQVFTSVQGNLKEGDEENPAIKDVMEKSIESYKHHNESVNDAISYYYELFGESANDNIASHLEKVGMTRESQGEAVAEVEVKTTRTSEKVD